MIQSTKSKYFNYDRTRIEKFAVYIHIVSFILQDSFTILPQRDSSAQTDDWDDDETGTLDSGFDNESVLVETLESRLYESFAMPIIIQNHIH